MNATATPANSRTPPHRQRPPAGAPRPLARYTRPEGVVREIVTRRLPDAAILVIDCTEDTHRDPRLLGRLEPDEPASNARLLTRLYLADEHRRCRRLRRSDLDVG